MPLNGDRPYRGTGASFRPWSSLTPAEQLELREAYGHHLDGLPPTCDLDTKIARFERWLLEHEIRYDGPR